MYKRQGPYTLAVPTSHVASIEKMEIPSTGAGGGFYDLGDRLGIGPHMRNPTRIIKLRRPPPINGTLPGGTPDCFTVDAVIGNVPLMIMPSGELLAKAGSFAGIGIMENGDLSILLDMEKAWEIS